MGLGDDLDSFFSSSTLPIPATGRTAPTQPQQQPGNQQGGQSSPFDGAFFPSGPSSNVPPGRSGPRQNQAAMEDPFPVSSAQSAARATPFAQQNTGSDFEDDFLGAFSSTPKPPQASKSGPTGGMQPMQSAAAKPNEPSRSAQTAASATPDADDDFMSGWSAAPSSLLQQSTAQSTGAASGGDPFDLFGDAGGIAAMPAAPPPAKSAVGSTHSQPTSPAVSRTASPIPAGAPAAVRPRPPYPTQHATSPTIAHLQPTLSPPSYDDVMSPPTAPSSHHTTTSARAASSGVNGSIPNGTASGASMGSEPDSHPNFPRGPPSGGGRQPAGGGSFWAQQGAAAQRSQQDEQQQQQPLPAARAEAAVPSRRPLSPRSQTASPRVAERVRSAICWN